MGAPTAPAPAADVDDTTAAAAVTSDTSDDAGAATVDGTITVTLCSPQSLVLLTVLPFCNICGFLWIYTALPLHFLYSGWALWKLSTLLTVAYIPRVAMTTVTAHVGDWICVPVSATAAVLNLNLLLHPESLAAVWAAVTATCAALNPPAYRSLVYARFLVGPKEQLRRALRIFTLADTLGYACAPFLGGLLYDGGGLRAGTGFATATCAVGGLLPLGLDECRASFREFKRRGMCAGAQAAAEDEKDRSGPPHEEKELEEAAKARGGNSVPANGSVPISEHGGTRAATAVVMGAAFVNIFVYGVEWCLYALYFHLEYGWSGAWCGLAQMAGDLIAASVLGASTVAGAAAVLGRFCPRPPRLARALARPPHSLALLALCHAALLAMLAQPLFVVALLGQVLMGTVYVFFEQGCQELLVLYSRGDHPYYRRLVAVHYYCFTAGSALCSPVAYGLYVACGDFSGAFYAASAMSATAGAGIACYYARRMARTPVGALGSLAAAEECLAVARWRESTPMTSRGG